MSNADDRGVTILLTVLKNNGCHSITEEEAVEIGKRNSFNGKAARRKLVSRDLVIWNRGVLTLTEKALGW